MKFRFEQLFETFISVSGLWVWSCGLWGVACGLPPQDFVVKGFLADRPIVHPKPKPEGMSTVVLAGA